MSALTSYWRGALSLLARVGVARPAIRALPHTIRSMGVAVPRAQPARRLWTGAGKKGEDDEPPAPVDPAPPAPPAEGAAADPTTSAAMAADEKLAASDSASAEGGDASDAAAAGAEGAGAAESDAKEGDSLQSAGERAAATHPTRRLR